MNDTDTGSAPTVSTERIRELLALLAPAYMLLPSEAAELAGLVNELLARPVPGVTVNGSHTIRHVIDGKPAEPGLLRSWLVAAEDPEGRWVTWDCYALDGAQTGRLGFNAGHYFENPDKAVSKRRALRDLARRAGVPVATTGMDEDEAATRLTDSPFSLGYEDTLRLMQRADAKPGTEVRKGSAALTRLERTAVRYDLRELGAR